jgi:16S rRNA (cytosine967-C5)-methyltransferase
MRSGARADAAIAILADIEARKRPASDAIKDWGLSHRFAGSKDRVAISQLVYDAFRVRASASFGLGMDAPRAWVLGALHLLHGLSAEDLAALFTGADHAPAPLSEAEQARLKAWSLEDAPDWVCGNYPEWLNDEIAAIFGPDAAHEGAALAARPPIDLRVNALKCDREAALKLLAPLGAGFSPFAPSGLRIPPPGPGLRTMHLESEPAWLKGLVEAQDEGSQLAAALAGARAGMQVADICAGAGGKTLALAADMENRGQVFAYDSDARRLAPLRARLERAGVRNVQVRQPRPGALDDLAGRIDLVVADAPCTGVGVWRRRPDAKWRLRPGALEIRHREQAAVLDLAARLVKPGGRLVYITCSFLPSENDAQIAAALARHAHLRPADAAKNAEATLPPGTAARLLKVARLTHHGLQLSPRSTGTDGFYVARLDART